MADLGLQLVKKRGRPPSAVHCQVRELTAADIPLLALTKVAEKKPLKRLRDSHHSVARMIAEGYSHVEISGIIGYTTANIRILEKDPSFQELVEFYRSAKREVIADVDLQMKMLLRDTVQELAERLHEDAAQFSLADLQDQTKLLADRTGHGPSSRQQVDVRIGIAERLEAARSRMKDVTPSRVSGSVAPEFLPKGLTDGE